jgi:hypothetical protein
MTHTPGPWHRNIPPARKYQTIWAGRNTHVAALSPNASMSDAELEANINLIAAAPDMLEALLHVRKIIAEGALTGFNCHDGDWAERLFASQQMTSVAVEKAGASSRCLSSALNPNPKGE